MQDRWPDNGKLKKLFQPIAHKKNWLHGNHIFNLKQKEPKNAMHLINLIKIALKKAWRGNRLAHKKMDNQKFILDNNLIQRIE